MYIIYIGAGFVELLLKPVLITGGMPVLKYELMAHEVNTDEIMEVISAPKQC